MPVSYLLRPPVRSPEIRRNFALTMELYAAGEAMKRQQFRRENPGATEEEIEAMVVRWLSEDRSASHISSTDRSSPPRPPSSK